MSSPRISRWLVPGAVALALLAALAFLASPLGDEPGAEKILGMQAYSSAQQEPITPIPLNIKLNPGKVALGQRLFNDLRLSRDGSVSCGHCHMLSQAGSDGLMHPWGSDPKDGEVNTPTVLNSGLNFRQFWDGRAATLEDQLGETSVHPASTGASWVDAVSRLSGDAAYRTDFLRVYGRALDREAVQDAIASYERSLSTPNSRLDRYLRGEQAALSSEEFAGYELFKSLGCIACHQGVNVGGNMFEEIGLVEDYFAARGSPSKADLGRFNHTGRDPDRHHFRVPSLRNVALTAPYFHDGHAQTLEQAVTLMAKFQLGVALSDDDTAKIVKFLQTLSGDMPAEVRR